MNLAEAEKWGLLGAKHGDLQSQLLLGLIYRLIYFYLEPAYEKKNLIKAYKWLLIAKAQGNQNVDEFVSGYLKDIENGISESDKAIAQDFASQFKPLQEMLNEPRAVVLPEVADNLADNLTKQEANEKLEELGLQKSRSTFFKAVQEDNLGVFKLYLKAGASIEDFDASRPGVTPLFEAVDYGSSKITRYLLDVGANVNAVNQLNGLTVLLRAISHERRDIADELLKRGADASQRPESEFIGGVSALMYSLGSEELDFIKRLFEAGASIDERYYRNETPLMIAAEKCNAKKMKYLIDLGADVNAVTDTGESVLMKTAMRVNAAPCVETLIKNGADVKLNKNGIGVLFYALRNGDPDVISALAVGGVNINTRYNLTHEKIPLGFDKTLRDLVMSGGTPLMILAYRDHVSAAKTLLEFGADKSVSIEGEFGSYTAMSIAETNQSKLMIDILSKNYTANKKSWLQKITGQ